MKTIDYSKALSWFIKDKKFWPTVLTMSLYSLSCVLIIPLFYVIPVTTGYSIALAKKIQNDEYELPEFPGDYWKDGVVFALLMVALSTAFGILVSIFAFGGVIFSSILKDSSESLAALSSLGTQGIGFLLQMLSSIIAPLVTFAFYAIYAKTGSINSLFDINNYKKIWAQNKWGFVVASLIYMVAASALATVGFMACCIGILPATAISSIMMASIIGQLSVEGLK